MFINLKDEQKEQWQFPLHLLLCVLVLEEALLTRVNVALLHVALHYGETSPSGEGHNVF